MTRQEALAAVRQTTVDLLTAVQAEVLDDEELDWLNWLRMRSVEQARALGVEHRVLKAAIVKAIVEVTA